jgi:hypothetical protein
MVLVMFPHWRLAGKAEEPEKTTRPLGWRTSTLSSRVPSIELCFQIRFEPWLAGLGVEVDSAGPRTEVDVPADPFE